MGNNLVIKKAISGIKFTFFSQMLVLILGVVKSFVLPKILSIPDYGYWQVYVLYSTYVGMLCLGYNDGIYLKYGKNQYDELPANVLRSSNRYYILMLVFFTVIATGLSLLVADGNRCIALFAVSIDIILLGISGMLISVLQITNQIKAYSFYTVLDKVILLIAIVIIGCMRERKFYWVVWADVFSKAVVMIALLFRCRTLFWGKGTTRKCALEEFISNIKIGISLMVANLMGMFVTGIGRFIVDSIGNIEEYAFYSFAISITNLVLVFISAVSLVLYPTLKRLPENNYGLYFEKLCFAVRMFNFVALFAYFPAVPLIKVFLPNYLPILNYIHFLFGVIVLQAKMQLLNNTFYKALRQEKALMRENMSCVIIFLVIAGVSYSIVHDISAIAFSTFFAMLYRCYASEVFIRRKMQLKVSKSIFLEVLYIILYVFILSFLDFLPAMFLYGFLFLLFFVLSWSELKKIFGEIRKGVL